MSTEFNISSREFLPHAQQIVGLTYFFSLVNTPNNDQSNLIRKWFWNTSFSQRYYGQTDDKMNADIAFFKKVAIKDYSGIREYKYTVNLDFLIKQKFSKSNPFTRSFLLLLAQKSPLNLVNGNKINLGQALSAYNSKEYHHIFPKAFLKDQGFDISVINSICNFCFLPASANKKISKKRPSDYIFNMVPSLKVSEILESNLMPLEGEIYSKDNYNRFLRERASLIIKFLEDKIA